MWSAKLSGGDLDRWSMIRKVSTAKPTCESTCEDIFEIDGVLWKNRARWVDVRPSVDLLENGRLWIEWKGSDFAYDLDQEEAEWLSHTLTDILKKQRSHPKDRERFDG